MTDDVDMVNHPRHYTAHPSGVECIAITEHMNFCIGNAVKYLWRADLKGGIEDLEKAAWYVAREIERRSALRVAEIVVQARRVIETRALDTSGLCGAPTLYGGPCCRTATPSGGRCWQHRDEPATTEHRDGDE